MTFILPLISLNNYYSLLLDKPTWEEQLNKLNHVKTTFLKKSNL